METMKLERRAVEIKELRIDTGQNGENSPPTIEGYASVFDTLSESLGGPFPFRERVERGAFAETIVQDDIRALFNHDPNYCLGRNKAGTLKLAEDEKGLLVQILPPNNSWANDLLESIKRGDITQMSFGFYVLDDEWRAEGGEDLRILKKVKLFDVSPVTFPAYTQTECNVRSLDDICKTKPKPDYTMLKTKYELLKENK